MEDMVKEYVLSQAYSNDVENVYSVNIDMWNNGIDINNIAIEKWFDNIECYECKFTPSTYVYYLIKENDYIIVGVKITYIDSEDKIKKFVTEGISEFIEYKAPLLLVGNEKKKVQTPTLGNLLKILLNKNMLNVSQRKLILQLVYQFLQSEMNLPRLFSRIGGILGYNTLRSIIENNLSRDISKLKLYDEDEISSAMPMLLNLNLMNALDDNKKFIKKTSLPLPSYFFISDKDVNLYFTKSKQLPKYLINISNNYKYPFLIEFCSNSYMDRIGHSGTISLNQYILITGGQILSEAIQEKHGFNYLTVIDYNDEKNFNHTLTGISIPKAKVGNSLLSSTPNESPFYSTLYTFGGCTNINLINDIYTKGLNNCNADEYELLDEFFMLQCQNFEWIDLSTVQRPSKRAYHVSINYVKDGIIVGKIIIGGIGKDTNNHLYVLNDAWYYDYTEKEWSNIEIENAPALAAASCTWLNKESLLVHGGIKNEKFTSSEVYLYNIKPENSKVRAVVTIINPAKGPVNIDTAYGSARCLHTMNVIQGYDSSCQYVKPQNNNNLATATNQKILITIVGGYINSTDITNVDNMDFSDQPITIFELYINEKATIERFIYVRNIPIENKPFSSNIYNYLPRILECAININLRVDKTNIIIPSIFVSGGYSISSYLDYRLVNRPSSELASYIINYHSVDHKNFKYYYTMPEESKKKNIAKIDTIAEYDMENARTNKSFPFIKRRKISEIIDEDLAQAYTIAMQHTVAWKKKFCFSPDILQTLATFVHWPFTCIGNILNNIINPYSRAENVYIDVNLAANGSFFISCLDDGRGISYSVLHTMLKRFGNTDGYSTMQYHKQNNTNSYGIGVKLAASRLARTALFITRTQEILGVSLLSESFLSEIGAQSVVAPTCFWKLPEKAIIDDEADHFTNQEMILKYSAFKEIKHLANEINLVPKNSGTLMIFSDMREDLGNFLVIDKTDGICRLANAATSPFSFNSTLPSPYVEKMLENSTNQVIEISNGINGVKTSNTRLTIIPNYYNDYDEGENDITHIIKGFPAFTKGENSIDCCLPTYMYWSHLFSPLNLYYGKFLLSPKMSKKDIGNDIMYNSLYRHLKRTLNGFFELDYLFDPTDSLKDAYGIIGFLNPLNTLIKTEATASTDDRLLETGILLYYNERLIKRLFVPLGSPTYILDKYARGLYDEDHFNDVTSTMLPSASYESFIAEKSPIFDLFCNNDKDKFQKWAYERTQNYITAISKHHPLSPVIYASMFKSVA